MKFDIYQLRTLAGAVLMSDRKSGFCLADHWGAAPGNYPGRHPVFLGDCDQFHPEATHVLMGTAARFTALSGCVGPVVAGPGDDPVAVRNPLAPARTYPVWVYRFNSAALPDCAFVSQ
jgi:hypothetical protein